MRASPFQTHSKGGNRVGYIPASKCYKRGHIASPLAILFNSVKLCCSPRLQQTIIAYLFANDDRPTWLYVLFSTFLRLGRPSCWLCTFGLVASSEIGSAYCWQSTRLGLWTVTCFVFRNGPRKQPHSFWNVNVIVLCLNVTWMYE